MKGLVMPKPLFPPGQALLIKQAFCLTGALAVASQLVVKA
jgi:hypothetical protein